LTRQALAAWRSHTGAMPDILLRAVDIRAGNALMYYPEANSLVPTTTDAASKTPAFKSVLVTIDAASVKPEHLNGATGRIPLELQRRS
jgi:hypothetical protein